MEFTKEKFWFADYDISVTVDDIPVDGFKVGNIEDGTAEIIFFIFDTEDVAPVFCGCGLSAEEEDAACIEAVRKQMPVEIRNGTAYVTIGDAEYAIGTEI